MISSDVCVLGGVICFAGISFNDYYNYNVYMKKESKQERERETERSIVYICERWEECQQMERAGERVARTSTENSTVAFM